LIAGSWLFCSCADLKEGIKEYIKERRNGSLKKVAFVSSYPPRKCGIAIFTSDLINNLKLAALEEPDLLVKDIRALFRHLR
jgi:hypothetical protein